MRDRIPPENLAHLHRRLIDAFTEEELRTVCLYVGVEYDHLPGRAMPDRARELLDLLDRRGGVEQLIGVCAGQRPEIAWDQVLCAAEAEPPFKGLEYYDVRDWPLFFGREAMTARLAAHLARRRLLIVVGASGSGKSSVVRAGLVHALQQGAALAGGRLAPESQNFSPVHVITPGPRPLESLAVSLARHAESVRAAGAALEDLLTGASSLHLHARKLLVSAPSGARLLVVVDQFEELFTVCRVEAERKALIDNLLFAGADENEGPTAVVIALRADFYPHCTQYENLRVALEREQVIVGRMDREEIRRAVEEPAHGYGWELQPGLVDLILQDVGDEPGALPLLSHTLLETWKRREGRTLTLAGYQASGGVRGAIAATADRVLAGLSEGEQAIARSVFLRLVEPGEGTHDTRRKAPLDELASSPEDTPAVQSVLRKLADARLVSVGRNAVELAHEALIREWPALREWLDQDRENLRVRRRLAADAAEWAALDRDPAALYRGARLRRAAEWAAGPRGQAGSLEREFLEASQAEAARQEAESAAQRQREQEAAREIERHARIAFARRLAADSASLLDSNLELALLIAAEANATADVAETRSALLSALQARPRLKCFLHPGSTVNAIAYSPDGSLLASGGEDGKIVLWDMLDLRAPAALGPELAAHEDYVSSLAFSPDGRTLASAGKDGRLILWDLSDPHLPTAFVAPQAGPGDAVFRVTYSPDGRTLASICEDGKVVLWDVSDPRSPVTLGPRLSQDEGRSAAPQVPDDATDDVKPRSLFQLLHAPAAIPLPGRHTRISAVAFSPDGRILVSGDDEGRIVLWDVSDRQAPVAISAPRAGHEGSIQSMAYSPDGRTLATGGSDQKTILWNVSNPGTPAPTGDPRTYPGFVESLAYSPGGQLLASGHSYGDILLWDMWSLRYPPEYESPLVQHKGGIHPIRLAFSPDGKTLASSGNDETIILWDMSQPPDSISAPLPARTLAVRSVAYSPDGKTLATGGGDGKIRLWDISDPRAPRSMGAGLGWHEGGLFAMAGLGRHGGAVFALAYSPDGRSLASGDEEGAVILWDVAGPVAPAVVRARLAGHKGRIHAVAFSPDGSALATGGDDGKTILWNVSDLSAPAAIGAPLGGNEGGVFGLAYGPDGRTLVSAGHDGNITLWDVSDPLAPAAAGALRAAHEGYVSSVAFAPDGRTLASGGEDGKIILWDLSDRPARVPIRGIPDWPAAVNTLAFSPDGRTLAFVRSSGESWGKVFLADVSDLHAPVAIGEPPESGSYRVSSVAYSPDGATLASAGHDGEIILWDVSDPHNATAIGAPGAGHTDAVYSLAYSPDAATLVSAGEGGTLILWEISGSRAPTAIGIPLAGHRGYVSCVAYGPDGRTIASGGKNGEIILWDVSDPRRVTAIGAPLAGHGGTISGLEYGPDGRTLASSGQDGKIILWDLADPAEPVTAGMLVAEHEDAVTTMACSPDGRTLASGGSDGKITLWDVSDSHKPAAIGVPLAGHGQAVSGLAYSPGGRTLISSGHDGKIMLWDVSDRCAPAAIGAPLAEREGMAFSVACSPDGRALVLGCARPTIVLWHVSDPRTPSRVNAGLNGHERSVHCVAYSPDGRTFASGGADNRVILWDADPASWQARARRMANRDLTEAERRLYLGVNASNRPSEAR